MELIGVLIFSMFIKAAVVEMAFAVRGKPSPRSRMKMAQVDADVKAGKRPTVGFGDFLGLLWNDVWADAIAKHKAKVAAGSPAKQPGAASSFLRNWWNDAWARAEAKRTDKQNRTTPDATRPPAQPPGQGQGRGRVAPTGTPQAQGQAQPTSRAPDPARPQPGQPDSSVVEIGTVLACGRCSRGVLRNGVCDRCGQPGDRGGDPAAQPQAGQPDSTKQEQQPEEVDTETPAATSPENQPTDPSAGSDGQSMGVVIPFTRKDSSDMTDAPGEVSGLASAQTYATEMSSAMAAQVPLTEQFMASLQGGGVSGEAVAAAARAQELSAATSAAWAEANEALQRQNVVKEAYQATPEAGNKEFVTSE